jgi:cold shock CspA family protein
MAPGSPVPHEGQRVQFETRSGLIGSQALNVRAVGDETEKEKSGS